MKAIKIFFACFVIATVAASLLAPGALWGLSSWRSASINGGSILAIAMLLLLNRRVADRFSEAGDSMGRTRGFRALAVILFLLLAFLLRSRQDLWGERTAVAHAIDGGLDLRPNAPLGMLVGWLFFRACNSLFLLTAHASTSLLSIITGACFLLAGFSAARTALGDADGETVTAAKIVFFCGSAFLFFGAGGNVPLSTLFALLFIISALRRVRGEVSLLVPTFLCLLAILSHISAIYLLPALIYLMARDRGISARRRGIVNALFLAAGALLVVEVSFSVLTESAGPVRYIAARAAALPAGFARIGAVPALMNALNAILLAGPAAIASLVMLIARARGSRDAGGSIAGTEKGLHTALVVPAFLLCLAAGWRMEAGLRWHIVASTCPAFALYLVAALRSRFSAPSDLGRALAMFAVLGIFHAAPLIFINALPAAAERRILALPLTGCRGETVLGVRAYEKHEFTESEKWLTAAADKCAGNDLARYYLGRLYMRDEYFVRAITRLNEACDLVPDSPRYTFALAEALIANDWYDEAIDRLEWLTTTYPDSIRFLKRLGYAKNHSGRYVEAIEIYRQVLMREPVKEENIDALVSAITNRGAELHQEGDTEGARMHYEWAIQLSPQSWPAQNNLAALELSLGNIERAYEILEKAVKFNPSVSKLNLNMGLTLEKMGRNEEAYEYLRKSYELDPVYSGAEPHLRRLLEAIDGKQPGQ